MPSNKWEEALDNYLSGFHHHNCHSRQAWFKGQKEPFPCDCDILDLKQQLTNAARELVVTAKPGNMIMPPDEPDDAYAIGIMQGYNKALDLYQANLLKAIGG